MILREPKKCFGKKKSLDGRLIWHHTYFEKTGYNVEYLQFLKSVHKIY